MTTRTRETTSGSCISICLRPTPTNSATQLGAREDYSYQVDDLSNVELPVNILNNDFRDPDLKRYLDRF